MSWTLLLTMAAFALAASISPGPVNLVGLSCGLRHGVRPGLVFVTGATLGFILLFLLIGLGLHSLLRVLPGFTQWLRWAGILFLLYLSWRLALDRGELQPESQARVPGFMIGALMQWLNPKAWLASVAGIGAYTAQGDGLQLLAFAWVYLVICWLSLACWVLAGAFLRRFVERPAVLRGLNLLLALLLAASSVYLMLDAA